jgi:AraC-like DNA-binding protein
MLAAYPLLRTRSTAEVVAYIESVAGLSLSKVGGDAPGETVINGLWLKRLSFASFRYGFEASIAPADDLSTYILSLPVRGAMRIDDGERCAVIAPGMGLMLSPGAPLAVAYPQDLHRIVIRVSVEALTRQFALMTGRAPAAPLRFDHVLRDDAAAFVALKRQLLATMARIDAGDLGPASELPFAEVESALLSAVILALPHDGSADLAAAAPAPSPRSVCRVVDYIHANADRPVTLEDLVSVSGVAGRTLFKHFQAFKGMGPMAYLRRIRMDRVREALAAAGPDETVTGIALRWNFHELGRFAGTYRRMFGEAPSATLRRGRRAD